MASSAASRNRGVKVERVVTNSERNRNRTTTENNKPKMYRRKKRTKVKQWDPADMDMAVKRVMESEWSVDKACNLFSVPAVALQSIIEAKKWTETNTTETNIFLTDEQETCLMNYVSDMYRRGFQLSSQLIRTEGVHIAKAGGGARKAKVKITTSAVTKWYRTFCKKHDLQSLRNDDRGSPELRQILNDFYKKLLEIVDRLGGIRGTRNRIWNVSEMCFVVETTREGVLLPSCKRPSSSQNQQKDPLCHSHSVLIAANGAGMTAPPLFVYRCTRPKPSAEVVDATPLNALVRINSSGCLTGELFSEWFVSFVKLISDGKAHLVLMEPRSLVTREVCGLAQKHNVELLAIPASCLSVLQPLDVTVCQSLKEAWTSAVGVFAKPHDSADYCRIFTRAYHTSLTSTNIVDGFRKTGIHPFNSAAVSDSALREISNKPKASARKDMHIKKKDEKNPQSEHQKLTKNEKVSGSSVPPPSSVDDVSSASLATSPVEESDVDVGVSSVAASSQISVDSDESEAEFETSEVEGQDDDDPDDDVNVLNDQTEESSSNESDEPDVHVDTRRFSESEAQQQILKGHTAEVTLEHSDQQPLEINQTAAVSCRASDSGVLSDNSSSEQAYGAKRKLLVASSAKADGEDSSKGDSNSATSEVTKSVSRLQFEERIAIELRYLEEEHLLRMEVIHYEMETAQLVRRFAQNQHEAAMGVESRKLELVENASRCCCKCGGRVASEHKDIDVDAMGDCG